MKIVLDLLQDRDLDKNQRVGLINTVSDRARALVQEGGSTGALAEGFCELFRTSHNWDILDELVGIFSILLPVEAKKLTPVLELVIMSACAVLEGRHLCVSLSKHAARACTFSLLVIVTWYQHAALRIYARSVLQALTRDNLKLHSVSRGDAKLQNLVREARGRWKSILTMSDSPSDTRQEATKTHLPDSFISQLNVSETSHSAHSQETSSAPAVSFEAKLMNMIENGDEYELVNILSNALPDRTWKSLGQLATVYLFIAITELISSDDIEESTVLRGLEWIRAAADNDEVVNRLPASEIMDLRDRLLAISQRGDASTVSMDAEYLLQYLYGDA